MISPKLLFELRQILEEEYNLKLTMAEVTEVAMTLVNFAETAMKIEAKQK